MLNGSKDAESHKDVPFWVKNETLKSAAQLFTAKTEKKNLAPNRQFETKILKHGSPKYIMLRHIINWWIYYYYYHYLFF